MARKHHLKLRKCLRREATQEAQQFILTHAHQASIKPKAQAKGAK